MVGHLVPNGQTSAITLTELITKLSSMP
jgi:hypothetical protein